MLRIEIIKLLNASNKSTHVLCIDRKLGSLWVEWRSYHICRCSRTYILDNSIHQLHNVFLLRRTSRRTDSRSKITDREFRTHAQVARTHVGIADSVCGNTWKQFTNVVSASYKRKRKICILLNFITWICLTVHFKATPPQEKYVSWKKLNILSLWFTVLRIPVSTFRNVYVNAADHVTKSDLNSKTQMAATIMAWFSRGIPLGIWQFMRRWNVLNRLIKTWIVNLSIACEDSCCQCSNFDHSASTWPGFLLSSPPRDFKHYWIWPSLRSERKSSRRVRFELD